MCRWAAYVGRPVFLEELISRPGHSLIAQSHQASECKTAINADGVGIAWYDRRPEPGRYRDVYPAWSDPNLQSLAAQVQARLFLCHVRASTGTATSRNNCHPFVSGRWSFMHNGQVGGFERFRRRADMLVPDHLYGHRMGATDSEVLFLLALAEGLDSDPRAALARACATLIGLSAEHGDAPHLRMTAAFSDGERLYAVRYSTDAVTPTLYHRWDDSWGGRAVVSEPLEEAQDGWCAIPPGSFCLFEGDRAEVSAFDPLREGRRAA